MRITRRILFIAAVAAVSLQAQDQSVKEAQFAVSGNCGMCKSRIEKAVKIKPVKFARWNKQTHILTVAFVPSAITVDSLQRRIASVGHDTEPYKAPDDVYAALPACCLYRGEAAPH